MPMPMEYWNASREFDRFLLDVRDACMLSSHNQAYHTLRAVLHVFRSHLPLEDALTFAGVLPPVVRAIFVEDWDAERPVSPFPDRQKLIWEVQHVRQDHNVAPETATEDVAGALRRHIDEAALDRALSSLCPNAASYWRAN